MITAFTVSERSLCHCPEMRFCFWNIWQRCRWLLLYTKKNGNIKNISGNKHSYSRTQLYSCRNTYINLDTVTFSPLLILFLFYGDQFEYFLLSICLSLRSTPLLSVRLIRNEHVSCNYSVLLIMITDYYKQYRVLSWYVYHLVSFITVCHFIRCGWKARIDAGHRRLPL